MKTLTVTLADIEGVPHGSVAADTSARVFVSYTGPVVLTSGEVIPRVVKDWPVPSTGAVEFSVHASDDPLVKAECRGFAVRVEVRLTDSRSGKAAGRWERVVKPLEAMASPISLGTLDPAEPLPPQFTSVQEMLDSIADGEVTGIVQTISLSGSNLTLSDGGGTVTLPSGGGTGAVSSVNGQTGAVALDAADVGALPSTYTPPAQSWGVITGKPLNFPPSAHSHSQAEVAGLDAALSGKAAKQTPADYGTGAPSASTVLYGDGQWKAAPTGGGGGSSTLTVKVSDYCTGSGSDEATGLRAAVAESLSTGAVLECDVPGQIGLGSTVILGDERANSQQVSILTMVGSLKVKATTTMQRLITFSGTVNTSACDIEANGDNKANFTIYGDNFGRSTFGRFHAYSATTAGVYWEPSGNSNAWSIEKLRVTGCGARHTASATVTGREVTGSWLATGGGAPYTTWTFATAMPASLAINEYAAPVVIMGDGRFMQVKRVVNSTTIEVFNEDKPMSTTETITLLSAAVNIPFYGDIGIFSIGNADVRDNPNAAAMAYGGYGGHVDMWAQQNNYAGVMLLERATGISFSHFYTELSGVWLVVRSTALTGLVVGPGANGSQSNWQGMDRSWMNPVGRNKQPMHWIMSKPSGSPTVAAPAIPVDAPELNPGTRNITPGTVQAYNRTSGNYALRIDNNYTTGVGQVMLAAPDTGGGITITLSLLSSGPGHTIEGSTTWSKTGVVGSVMLTYWLEGSTWRVRVSEATS